MSCFNVGYGVDISKMKLRDDAAFRLLSIDLPEGIADEYCGFCEDENVEPFPVDKTAAEKFADSYQNDLYCYSGIEGLFVDIINEKEQLDGHQFSYEDCCIYVPAAIPFDEAAKASLLTQERIRSILATYLPLITDQTFDCEWVDISD